MPQPVRMKELPLCDICKLQRPSMPNKANADSATRLGPWGYTCDAHKGYRVGPITYLKEEE